MATVPGNSYPIALLGAGGQPVLPVAEVLQFTDNTDQPGSGGGGSGTVTSVSSADTSIAVTDPTTTPTLQVATMDVLFTNEKPAASVPMNSQKLTGLAAGTGNGDSVRYEQVNGVYLPLAGGTMSGAIAMGSHKITGLTNGSAASDAAAFGQLPSLGSWASFTPSTTGITSDSGDAGFYLQIGSLVFVVYGSSGTSNATTKTFTLPVSTGGNGGYYSFPSAFCKDNGTNQTAPGAVQLTTSSSTATLYKTITDTAWTNSGSWQFNVCFFYGTN